MVQMVTRRTVRLRWAVRSRTPAAGAPPDAPCAVCARDVPVITTAQALSLLQGTVEDLAALIASGRVHGIPTVAGNALICRDSIFGRNGV